MAEATIRVTLACDLASVWDVVTSVEHCAWRRDINRVEVIDAGKFIEYAKNGYATTFTVTAMVPCQRWELDLENDQIRGHWIVLFSQADHQTIIELTERVVAKKLIMKPFAAMYLRKQQLSYVLDLKKAVQNEICEKVQFHDF